MRRVTPGRGSRDAQSRYGVRRAALLLGISASLTSLFGQSSDELGESIARLKSIPVEDLINIQVTTVSRRPERLLDVPSAVQVITAEDIRRSGATSLPEALRLAPNLQVAQIDSTQWAISARGFNAATANKLLVQIDGRTVYTPLFAGVFWDAQNVMLEDVDRIEVISGPGAALWGGNAVNGVINVVSKTARETQGTLISGGGGSYVNGFGSFRYGDKIGQDLYFRVYGTGFDRDNTLLPSGLDATNHWHLAQGGFRADWLPPQGDSFTLQGDFYGGDEAQAGRSDTTLNGQNVLTRWNHSIAEGSDTTLQVYWDRTWRKIPGVFGEQLNTLDLDFQNRVQLGARNKFMWGAGYRLMLDHVDNSAELAFLPAERNLQIFSGFIQDEIAVVEDRLFLTVGLKLEHNDYSGIELQPNARLAWKLTASQTAWAAISRAVRTPSRIDTEFFVPGVAPYFTQGGGDLFQSEKLVAYELGYRTEISPRLSGAISTFYNDYEDIRSVEPIAGAPGQFIILNGLAAQTFGAELSTTWQVSEWWRLRGGYTWFRKHIEIEQLDINQGRGEGNDPHHQFMLQSMLSLPQGVEFDSIVRYVDNLDQVGPSVPSYIALDLRLAWHPVNNVELAVVGQNLLDSQHPEFGPAGTRQELPRSVYGKVTLKF